MFSIRLGNSVCYKRYVVINALIFENNVLFIHFISNCIELTVTLYPHPKIKMYLIYQFILIDCILSSQREFFLISDDALISSHLTACL